MITKLNDQQIAQYEHDEDARAKKVILVNSSGDPEVAYDYIEVVYPAPEVELYYFKQGGALGPTVKTVAILYTDATKDNISTVQFG